MSDENPDIQFLLGERIGGLAPTDDEGYPDLDFLPTAASVEEAVDLQVLIEHAQSRVAAAEASEHTQEPDEGPLQPVGARRFVDLDPLESEVLAQVSAESPPADFHVKYEGGADTDEEEREADNNHPTDGTGDARQWVSLGLRLLRPALKTYQVGLDIGSSSVKYVILQRGIKGLQFSDCGTLWLPNSLRNLPNHRANEELVRFLKENLPLCRMADQQLATAVSGLEVVYRAFSVPRMPKKELKEAVPWAARNHLPYPVESAQIDFESAETSGEEHGKLRIHLLAAKSEVVEGHLELLRKVRLQPSRIGAHALAAARVVQQSKSLEHRGCRLVMDIGARTTRLAFMQQDELQFVREINTGGDDFTEVLTGAIFFEGRQVVWSERRAEEMKRTFGIPHEDAEGETPDGVPLREVAVQMRPVLERLINEVQRSIDYYQDKFDGTRVDYIYLCGGGALLKHLDRNLAKHLSVQVELLDPLAALGLDKGLPEGSQEQAPIYATALGLALETRKGLNLLPEPLRIVQKLHTVQKVLRSATVFAVLIFSILSITMIGANRSLDSTLDHLRQEYRRLQPRRQLYSKLLQAVETKEAKLADLQLALEPGQNAVQDLRALSNLTPSDVILTRVQITTRGQLEASGGRAGSHTSQPSDVIRIYGIVRSSQGLTGIRLAQYLLTLERSGYFRSIEVVERSADDEGNLRFTVDCGL